MLGGKGDESVCPFILGNLENKLEEFVASLII